MNLRYSLNFHLTPKIYLLSDLLLLILFSLSYIPISEVLMSLISVLVVVSVVELGLNAFRKKLVHIPEAALITALIITGVLATSTPLQVILLVTLLALLAKHFIRYKSRHIFNPANFGILIAVFALNQNIEWWIASNVIIIILFGLFIMYKLRQIWQPITFLVAYFILFFITSPAVDIQFIKSGLTADFSVYFFAFVMLPEPQTAPWTTSGKIVGAMLAALIAVVAGLIGIRAPLIVALAVVNIFTPIINRVTYKKNES